MFDKIRLLVLPVLITLSSATWTNPRACPTFVIFFVLLLDYPSSSYRVSVESRRRGSEPVVLGSELLCDDRSSILFVINTIS